MPLTTFATAGSTHWWYIGIGIGFAVVVVVVIVAAWILALASRIGQQAREGIEMMDEARDLTLPVWDVQRTNALLTVIWRAAEGVRKSLEGTKKETVR